MTRFWSEDLGYPGAKELGETYKAEHDGLDSVSIGLFYANVQILQGHRGGRLHRSRGRPAERLRPHFNGTVIGDVTIAKLAGRLPPLGLQWLDGKRVIVYPDTGNTWSGSRPGTRGSTRRQSARPPIH